MLEIRMPVRREEEEEVGEGGLGEASRTEDASRTEVVGAPHEAHHSEDLPLELNVVPLPGQFKHWCFWWIYIPWTAWDCSFFC